MDDVAPAGDRLSFTYFEVKIARRTANVEFSTPSPQGKGAGCARDPECIPACSCFGASVTGIATAVSTHLTRDMAVRICDRPFGPQRNSKPAFPFEC